IGIFGLMGEEADSNAPMSGVEFESIIDASEDIVGQLEEEDVDLIVAISHSGTSADKKSSEDELLAEAVPEIDVIVSGHSHTFLEEPIIVGDTVIGSTGEYGENLGVLTLRSADDGWELVDYELKRLDESVAEDEGVKEEIEVYKASVQAEYLDYFDLEFDEVVGQIPFHITDFESMSSRHEEDPLANVIGDAYLYTAREHDGEGAEPITASVVPVGTIRSSLYEGEITVSDVFNISSLGIGKDGIAGYPLVEVYVTGKELKTIAEVDASVSPIMKSAQLYVAGLEYTFNPHRLIFNKVTDVKIRNDDGTTEEIDDDKLYRLVAGLYSGQMLPVVNDQSYGLLSLVPKDENGEPIEDFEDHILYMNDGSDREIKEWYALANYIQSFPEVDGVPEVAEEYSEVQGRKVVHMSRNIIDLVKKPNGIAFAVYGIGVVGVIAIVFLVRFIVRRVRRRRGQKKAA
ncbi:MAG TPA: 5'-nucleotidase C-terminal domain-containing protein, partial [Virgibacillus sp.]|nr:5'-nucleotidase C-terminal domain-containing protein [Virgibacillus sp.]